MYTDRQTKYAEGFVCDSVLGFVLDVGCWMRILDAGCWMFDVHVYFADYAFRRSTSHLYIFVTIFYLD